MTPGEPVSLHKRILHVPIAIHSLHPNSDGLHPTSDGLQPAHDGLQPDRLIHIDRDQQNGPFRDQAREVLVD